MHAQTLHQTQVPSSVAATFVVVSCCQLSYIHYIYRHCDLLALRIEVGYQYHINGITRN